MADSMDDPAFEIIERCAIVTPEPGTTRYLDLSHDARGRPDHSPPSNPVPDTRGRLRCPEPSGHWPNYDLAIRKGKVRAAESQEVFS